MSLYELREQLSSLLGDTGDEFMEESAKLLEIIDPMLKKDNQKINPKERENANNLQ